MFAFEKGIGRNRCWPLIVLAGSLAGCGAKPEKLEPRPPQLQQIQVLYRIYVQRHNGVGPRNREEFKQFIQAQGKTEAKRLDVDLAQLDRLFVSPRDGQPYSINYGLRLMDEVHKRQIIISEMLGRDGKREIGFLNGWIEEVDADKADELSLKTN